VKRNALRVASLALLLGLTATACGTATHSSPEYHLALLDGRPPTGENDPVLAPYRVSLHALHGGCKDHPTTRVVANEVVVAQKSIKRHGISYTLLQVAKGGVLLLNSSGNHFRCAQLFALVTATNNPLSSEQRMP
jgi:hypothetical protein